PGEQESLLRAWSQGGLSRRYQRVLLGKSIEVQHEGQVVRKGIARDKAVEKISDLTNHPSSRATFHRWLGHRRP
ncbi:MAG: hypothetical protein MUF31_12365, partial [Akkermansiaceae bacterium]|nr:hypothetical protein [Akkermansiaceae bacterium]